MGLAAGAALPPLSDAVVAVVGGGIGGAAVALALQQRGIAVRVYERDGSFSQRAQGYGLTMQQGAHALRRLGLENSGVFSVAHRSFLPDGTAIGGYGRALHASTRDALGNGRGDAQRRNAHIPRQALRKSLVDALRPGTIAWGRALRSFDADADGGGVTLHLDDTSAAPGAPPPPPERAALLVGADGIYSAVRTQLLGDAAAAETQKDPPLRYLGVVVVLGRAPCDHPLAKEQVFQTLDGTTRVYCMPFVDGVSMWQLSFRLSEAEARAMPRDGASLRAEALRRVGGWHAPLPQLVADTRPEDVTGYPAYDRDPLPSSGGPLGGGRRPRCSATRRTRCRRSRGRAPTRRCWMRWVWRAPCGGPHPLAARGGWPIAWASTRTRCGGGPRRRCWGRATPPSSSTRSRRRRRATARGRRRRGAAGRAERTGTAVAT